jgi:cobyrinic acid a,c-diamide synthase
LQRQGQAVQPFKKGPDFIDPGWHSLAAVRQSRNLDSFFMSPEQIRDVFSVASHDARLSVIEGAMGLYDGLDVHGSASSAEIAKVTNTPVVLVLDVTRMTRTAAALVLGCQQFDPEVNIRGVILNRVRGARQEALLRETIRAYCGLEVVGTIPTDERMTIPSRHLGLISSTEADQHEHEQTLEAIADAVARHVDLEMLLTLADGADELPVSTVEPISAAALGRGTAPPFLSSSTTPAPSASQLSKKCPRIAVGRDAAFCFYYPENLLALEAQGAELIFINSMRDNALPANIDALYIGGGFPESYASELEANGSFRASVRQQAEAGLPICAECGGLMYLGRRLNWQGQVFEMVGALPLDIRMQEQRQAHGYTIIRATQQHPWLAAGAEIKGHEFHHSQVVNLDPCVDFAYLNQKGNGVEGGRDGIVHKGIVATYTHVNAFAAPHWAQGFVARANCQGSAE